MSSTSESFCKTHWHSLCAKQNRCFDVTLSRQEGSTTCYLANAQYQTSLASGNPGHLFPMFSGLVCTDKLGN